MAQPKTGQPQTRRLGDLLVAEGLITDVQLKQALGDQKGKTEKLGSILVKLGFITEEQLIGFLSRQYGIPSITLDRVEIDAETLRLVPTAIALKYEVLPVKRIGGTLTLAMADPTNVFALDDIAFMTNLQILPVVAPQAAIRKGIEKYYEAPTSSMTDMLSEITAEVATSRSSRAPKTNRRKSTSSSSRSRPKRPPSSSS
jgi:type IV pilus assembly protein PilB